MKVSNEELDKLGLKMIVNKLIEMPLNIIIMSVFQTLHGLIAATLSYLHLFRSECRVIA